MKKIFKILTITTALGISGAATFAAFGGTNNSTDESFAPDLPVIETEPEEIIINLTNTKTDETVIVKGTKTWEDGDNKYNIRPDSIEINLYADGEDTGLDTTASEETGWTYEFEGQPKYDEDGNKNEYTIKETAVKGYTVSYEKITTSDIPDDEEQEDVDYSVLLDKPTISFVFNDGGDREATAQALQNNARYYFVKSYTDGAGETHKVNGSISGYSVDSNTPQTVEPYEVDFSYNDKTFPKYTDTYLNT